MYPARAADGQQDAGSSRSSDNYSNTSPMQTTRVLSETIIYCADVRRFGPGVNARMVWYWRRKGIPVRVDGKIQRSQARVTLEWAMHGGRPATSLEAIERFRKRVNGEGA